MVWVVWIKAGTLLGRKSSTEIGGWKVTRMVPGFTIYDERGMTSKAPSMVTGRIAWGEGQKTTMTVSPRVFPEVVAFRIFKRFIDCGIFSGRNTIFSRPLYFASTAFRHRLV